jgi:hypothetical protein
MTFLNPLALLGLAAASIPVIVHLFNFRRPRKVDFSSLTFLKELEKNTMRRVRLKQWLLLLLRTLAIACLVLAFARPTLTGGAAGALGGQAPVSLGVVVDNSLSMTLRDAQGEYLKQAKEQVATLIQSMQRDDEVFVLPVAGADSARPDAYRNTGAALEALGSLTAQPGAPATSRALSRAASLLSDKAAHPNRELYLLSDLQQSTLTDTLSSDAPEGIGATLLPVGNRQHANVAVTGVTVESRIIEQGRPAEFQATLTNFGDEALSGYTAHLSLAGERVAQASTNLPADQSATVTFTATPPERGWLAGRVKIEDDAFALDNERHFTLNVPEERRLLVVRGRGQPIRYLEAALSPGSSEGRAAFTTTTIGESELAATSLSGYDVVALAGLQALSSGEVASVARYVKQGGGLLFFPGAGAQAEDYNALLSQLGGGRIGGTSGTPGAASPTASFENVDTEHPLFEGVFAPSGGDSERRVEQADVYHAANYTAGGGAEQTIIELTSGFPFLQEVRHGRGAALLFAVAPNERWSDLPTRGLFAPLMFRAVYYLSAGGSGAGRQLTVGEATSVRLTSLPETEEPLRLVGPEGESFTPEQRTLFGAVLLQLDGTPRPVGIYDVRTGETLVRRLAYNLPEPESNLSTLAAGEAADRLQEAAGLDDDVSVLSAGEGDETISLQQELVERRVGMELWNVFLLAALGFLLAEMVVARRWKPEAASATA